VDGQRFAILIANSEFPKEPELNPLLFPKNDVKGLKEVLSSDKHGQFVNVLVLENATSYEARVEIERLFKNAHKDELILIYYSGHGKLGQQGQLHLATADTEIALLGTTSIPMEEIKSLIDKSPSNKKVIILDCCNSGAAGKNFKGSCIDDQLHRISEGCGTYIMTASSSIQPAIERQGDEYSVFTKHIINGIKSGEADIDEDGEITMDELYQYVYDNVRSECPQTPKKWEANVEGKLVIAKSDKIPREERRRQIRKMLCKLGMRDILTDKILIEALAVNASVDECSERPKCIDLLNQLADNKIKVGDFIHEWYQLTVKTKTIPKEEVVSSKTTEARKEIKVAVQKTKHQLRKEPMTLSDEEARYKFRLNDKKRPLEYIQNDFRDNGDTITDLETGLMWQKAGSPNKKIYIEALAYIKELNDKKFAGYSSWRMPTVDELKSLLTPKEINDSLSASSIDPIFDRTQSSCWTSDRRTPSGARLVNFNSGSIGWSDLSIDYYVRAVRSFDND